MQREKYIDLAKGIGIIMVIFCHVIEVCKITSLKFIFRFCYSFHMPLFFFITGYCLGLKKDTVQKPEFLKATKKTALSLLLPYLVWSFIYLFIGGNIGSSERLIALFTTRGIAPIWFLAALGLSQIFFYAFKSLTYKLKEKTSNLLFAITALVFLLIGYIIMIIGDSYSFSADTIGTTVYYLYIAVGRFFLCTPILIGGYLFGKANIIKRLNKLLSFILGGALITAVYFAVDFFNLKTNIHLFSTNNYPVLIFTAFLGAVGVLMLSYSLPTPTGLISLIGINSIYFMLLHYMPFKTIETASQVFDFVGNPWLYWICTSLGVIAITAVGTYILKRGFFLTKKKSK